MRARAPNPTFAGTCPGEAMKKPRATPRKTKARRTSRPALASHAEQARIVHALGERVKELTALHETARILHDEHVDLPELLGRIATLMPPAFQFPEVTAALLRYGDTQCVTAGYRESPWVLESCFRTRDGVDGAIRVIYTEERPQFVEGPFLLEERRLLDSLAEILRTALDRRHLAQQLSHSQKMEAMGRLAGGIAHDFNNLLTAIRGYSEFVAEALEPEDQRRKDVDEIAAAADRAAALTRQLLAFSRHQVLAPKVIDANTIVAGVENLLRRLIGSPIELRAALSAEVASIRADPGQLEQVVINLAVNARDAMPNGGVLTIATSLVEFDERIEMGTATLPPARYAIIAVSDTGTGMTAETKARLFEPFFTTKEAGRGTGLGLATVYGIVQQSGGSIAVFSEPGAGATFKVFLPWVGSAVEAPVSALDAPVLLRGTESVLFVDDDAQVRALAERALRVNGYHATVCANGEEALRIVASNERAVDVVVTDIVMPRIAGPALYARIRAKRPRAKVLYITGFTEHRDDVQLPASSVLQKPFTPSLLLRSVRRVLDAG